jgi:hypothetical protein
MGCSWDSGAHSSYLYTVSGILSILYGIALHAATSRTFYCYYLFPGRPPPSLARELRSVTSRYLMIDVDRSTVCLVVVDDIYVL